MRREKPNHLDPLSEPTINRRIWAAYLKAGYTRASFAREMGMSYPGLDRWDTGEVVPCLELVMLAARKLGYTMDQLCYGQALAQPAAVDQLAQALAQVLERLEKIEQQLQHQLRVSEYWRTAAALKRAPRVVVVTRQVDCYYQGIMAECR